MANRRFLPSLPSILLNSIFAVLMACVATSCESGDKSTTIRGKILDKSTLLPIDSAWVNTIDTTDGARYSNAEGSFSLTTFGRIQKFYTGKGGYHTRLIELPEDENARQNIVVELERILGGCQKSTFTSSLN